MIVNSRLLLMISGYFYSGLSFVPLPMSSLIQRATQHSSTNKNIPSWTNQNDNQLSKPEGKKKVCILRCKESNRYIECELDLSVKLGDKSYSLFHPLDQPVAIVFYNINKQAIPINPDSPEMYDLLPVFKNSFDDKDLKVLHSAGVLTMCGDIDAFNEDDEKKKEQNPNNNLFELRSTPPPDWEVDNSASTQNSGNSDAVEVLVDFEYKDEKYSFVKLLEPICMIGERDESFELDDTRFVLLSSEENKRISPLIDRSIELEIAKNKAPDS